MLELDFKIEEAQPEPMAAAPTIRFRLGVAERLIANAEPTAVASLALRCQIRIEPARRRYTERECQRLLDLFGTAERWGQTLRPFLWTHIDTIVRPFAGSTVADLLVPCSYDFSLAATKYFDAIEAGEIPLCFLFSGTVFYEDALGHMQIARVPWDREAYFRLESKTWRSMMDLYYPDSAWLCLRKDVFDRLNAYRSRHGFTSWEQALEALEEAQRQLATS
jgi:hypothetical protein